MPASDYESRTDSVLAWKKNQKLGRFDPNAPDLEQQKIFAIDREIEERGKLFSLVPNPSPKPLHTSPPNSSTNILTSLPLGITLNSRCHLLPSSTDDRRGSISYIGPIPEIPGLGKWIGITLDEPTGKNDGSVQGKRYFSCSVKCGVFVRPERVECGEFPVLDDLGEEMEEI